MKAGAHMIERKYKVAILNYPLMNPNLKINNFKEYIGLSQTSVSPYTVPLYIHVPFCGKICKFCIYNRQLLGEKTDLLKAYVESVKNEIRMWGDTPYVKSLNIGAIFFGGGTPTCLSSRQIEEIICTCRDYLPLNADAEITVECDVKNTDSKKVQKMSELGVNRVSTGVQTFNPYYRKLLGLNSTTEEVVKWIEMVKKHQINVVSIDLMYGLPGQSVKEWVEDLKTGFSLPIDHFSIYELCVLTGSKLYEEYCTNSNVTFPGQEHIFNMYTEADKALKDKGYQHHIIPEYNWPGKQSRFWELTYDGYGDNLSVGASSYGYINGVNYQNISSVDQYIDVLSEGRLPIEMLSEKATVQQIMERSIVLGLRRKFVEMDRFLKEYGRKIEDEFEDVLVKLEEEKLICREDGKIVLTSIGEYLQGDVSSMFMNSTFDKVSAFRKQLSIGKHIVPEALYPLPEQ